MDHPRARLDAALSGAYRLERELGAGGMATVYLARDVKHDRQVALKVLRPELAAVLGGERFLREIRIAAGLDHPHILTLIDSGESDGLLWYVLPYVRGESLREKLTREKQLGVDEALAIATQVAGALDYAHRQGVIHRDLKPENILLHEGEAMLADFGIALAVREAGGDRLTETGISVGTPHYMSPEQAAGDRQLDARSDVYSLAAVLYEMLAGAPPHTGPTAQAIITKLLTERPAPIRAMRDAVPAAVEAAVAKALAKVPADRFAGAGAFARALGGPGTRAATSPARRLSRRTAGLAVGALAIVLAAGFGVSRALRSGPPAGVDPRRSLLIGFFDNTRREPALEWLRLGGVELLARSLARWQDLDVVNPERLLDLTRRAQLDENAPMTKEEAVRLARAAGVWTASVGSILPERDSLRITVRLYDVASGRQLGQASVAAAGDTALPAAFAALAEQIFDVSHVPQAVLVHVDPPTRSVVAWRAYVEGLRFVTRWRIDSAEARFQAATRADPTFALAYAEEAYARLGRQGPIGGDTTYVRLADSAVKYAAGRPEKERLYLQALGHFFHARLPEARAAFAELLRRDSTRADAWVLAGLVANWDHTLRRLPDGRLVLPGDRTFALRAYRRALALDASDHRAYFFLGMFLRELSFDTPQSPNRIPGYADPPPGALTRLFRRPVTRWYNTVLMGDSVVLVPQESLFVRFTRGEVDAARAAARDELKAVLARWLALAPDEPRAHSTSAMLARSEGRWDDALAEWSRAEQLGERLGGEVAYLRLGTLLDAYRLGDAGRLADSLAADSLSFRAVRRDVTPVGGLVANAWLAGGRVAEARELGRSVREDQDRISPPTAEQLRLRAIADTLAPLQMLARAERGTAEDLRHFAARHAAAIAEYSDSARQVRRAAAMGSLGLLAAALGDTGWLRRWRAQTSSPRRYLGLDAWAYARAGDRRGAERALAAFERDTSFPWPGNRFAAGRAAELLGNAGLALRYYGAVDSAAFSPTPLDNDWMLLVRSWKVRADVYRAIGDTANARRYYERVLDAWRRPDALLRPERDEVERRLAELGRRDVPR